MRNTDVVLRSGRTIELDLDACRFGYDLGAELAKLNPGVSFPTPAWNEGAFPLTVDMEQLEILCS